MLYSVKVHGTEAFCMFWNAFLTHAVIRIWFHVVLCICFSNAIHQKGFAIDVLLMTLCVLLAEPSKMKEWSMMEIKEFMQLRFNQWLHQMDYCNAGWTIRGKKTWQWSTDRFCTLNQIRHIFSGSMQSATLYVWWPCIPSKSLYTGTF